jgi:23S rRNA pseudouridine1911/1915/1917 synthase
MDRGSFFNPPRLSPFILKETEGYAVVYKPPLMHSAPLDSNLDSNPGTTSDTLLGWYAGYYPGVLELEGKKAIEGGLLHRLDFETEGLVLFAKTGQSLESFNAQQGAGQFVKEYDAIACGVDPDGPALPGFPPPPVKRGSAPEKGSRIESFFRPWGPGRKAVRPITGEKKGKDIARDSGAYYSTEILSAENLSGFKPGVTFGSGDPPPFFKFRLRIRRGFRHQIRCHLAWIGQPILNDTLYGGLNSTLPGSPAQEKSPLALRAEAFSFYDPDTGERMYFRISEAR